MSSGFINTAKDLAYDPNHQWAGLANINGAVNLLIDRHGLQKAGHYQRMITYIFSAIFIVLIIIIYKNNIDTKAIRDLYQNEKSLEEPSSYDKKSGSKVNNSDKTFAKAYAQDQKNQKASENNSGTEYRLISDHNYFEGALNTLEITKELLKEEFYVRE